MAAAEGVAFGMLLLFPGIGPCPTPINTVCIWSLHVHSYIHTYIHTYSLRDKQKERRRNVSSSHLVRFEHRTSPHVSQCWFSQSHLKQHCALCSSLSLAPLLCFLLPLSATHLPRLPHGYQAWHQWKHARYSSICQGPQRGLHGPKLPCLQQAAGPPHQATPA